MEDIDVVKWLEICGKNGDCSRCCPYEGDVNCRDSLMVDALELLKEQQNVIEQYHRADGFLNVHGWKW